MTKQPEIHIRDRHPPEWSECSTIEQWMRRAIREGQEEYVVTLMKTLPQASRDRYRKIYAELKRGKGK